MRRGHALQRIGVDGPQGGKFCAAAKRRRRQRRHRQGHRPGIGGGRPVGPGGLLPRGLPAGIRRRRKGQPRVRLSMPQELRHLVDRNDLLRAQHREQLLSGKIGGRHHQAPGDPGAAAGHRNRQGEGPGGRSRRQHAGPGRQVPRHRSQKAAVDRTDSLAPLLFDDGVGAVHLLNPLEHARQNARQRNATQQHNHLFHDGF
mmetsp:Transcript_7452/g.14606  ORF Transcript_7452/g.14606 Transcript_7452/m.14606 type:complete len:201 (-) Transcript_7452:160-762(-)